MSYMKAFSVQVIGEHIPSSLDSTDKQEIGHVVERNVNYVCQRVRRIQYNQRLSSTLTSSVPGRPITHRQGTTEL